MSPTPARRPTTPRGRRARELTNPYPVTSRSRRNQRYPPERGIQSPELALLQTCFEADPRPVESLHPTQVAGEVRDIVEQIIYGVRNKLDPGQYRLWLIPVNLMLCFALSACIRTIGFKDVLKGTGLLPSPPNGTSAISFILNFFHPRAEVGLKVEIVSQTDQDISIFAVASFPGKPERPDRTSSLKLSEMRDIFDTVKGFTYFTREANVSLPARINETRSQWGQMQLESFIRLVRQEILYIVDPGVDIELLDDTNWGPNWDAHYVIRAEIDLSPSREVPVPIPGETQGNHDVDGSAARPPTPPPKALQILNSDTTPAAAAETLAGREFLADSATLIHVHGDPDRPHPDVDLVLANIEALPWRADMPWGARPNWKAFSFPIIRVDAVASFGVAEGQTICPPAITVLDGGKDGAKSTETGDCTPPTSEPSSSCRPSADSTGQAANVDALGPTAADEPMAPPVLTDHERRLAEYGTAYICSAECCICGGADLAPHRLFTLKDLDPSWNGPNNVGATGPDNVLGNAYLMGGPVAPLQGTNANMPWFNSAAPIVTPDFGTAPGAGFPGAMGAPFGEVWPGPTPGLGLMNAMPSPTFALGNVPAALMPSGIPAGDAALIALAAGKAIRPPDLIAARAAATSSLTQEICARRKSSLLRNVGSPGYTPARVQGQVQGQPAQHSQPSLLPEQLEGPQRPQKPLQPQRPLLPRYFQQPPQSEHSQQPQSHQQPLHALQLQHPQPLQQLPQSEHSQQPQSHQQPLHALQLQQPQPLQHPPRPEYPQQPHPQQPLHPLSPPQLQPQQLLQPHVLPNPFAWIAQK